MCSHAERPIAKVAGQSRDGWTPCGSTLQKRTVQAQAEGKDSSQAEVESSESRLASLCSCGRIAATTIHETLPSDFLGNESTIMLLASFELWVFSTRSAFPDARANVNAVTNACTLIKSKAENNGNCGSLSSDFETWLWTDGLTGMEDMVCEEASQADEGADGRLDKR